MISPWENRDLVDSFQALAMMEEMQSRTVQARRFTVNRLAKPAKQHLAVSKNGGPLEFPVKQQRS